MALREFIGPIGSAIGVNLNSVADTAVTLPNGAGKYIITDMIVTNASTTLGASSMTIGAYSAVSAGGEVIVTPATATALTAASKFVKRTIAQDDTVTASPLYIRVAVVHGAAATADVYFYGYIVAAS
jgi:hypothetical protein